MVNKITIIGGSGFIGTNLCKKLSLKQQDFEIIDLKKSKSFPDKCKFADVRNIDSLRSSITGDVVINLAAVHRDDVRDVKDYEKTNTSGAQNIVADERRNTLRVLLQYMVLPKLEQMKVERLILLMNMAELNLKRKKYFYIGTIKGKDHL